MTSPRNRGPAKPVNGQSKVFSVRLNHLVRRQVDRIVAEETSDYRTVQEFLFWSVVYHLIQLDLIDDSDDEDKDDEDHDKRRMLE